MSYVQWLYQALGESSGLYKRDSVTKAKVFRG